VIHEANTAFMTVTWDTNRAIFKFYQPAGDYVGGSVVTRQGATFAATKLLGSSIQGTFGGSLTGLTQGIVSLTLIGGAGRAISRAIASRQIVPNTRTVKSPPVPHALIPASRAASGRTRDVSTTLQLVKAFAGNVVGNNLPAFAKDLINVIAAQRKTTGSSAIATSITTAALTGASTTAPFLNGGDPLMQGLTVVPMLADAAAALIVRIDLGEDVESKGDATNASASPANTNYITSVDFKIPDTTGDNSIVMGLAAAREFGSIPLSGVIDASNQLRISGTAKTGEQIVLTGNVVDNKVRNGAWNLDDTRAVTRAAGGSWDADPTQPGQCTVEENSGGQGIFTQTYDLGMNCGSFDFRYQAFSIPDQFQVFYEGKTMLDTGSVSGGTTVPILFGGTTNQVIVVVTASLEGTQWNYTVGCPTPHTT
ncbi:MAG: hypothetical protein JWN14_4089, partial [Chthonomonadales bacterium]|nr:hypothetical protein [Chthonomonadales bacterium]